MCHSRDKRFPKLWQKEWLEEQYCIKGLSLKVIAAQVGCSWGSVKNALIALKIKRRRYTISAAVKIARRKGGFAKKRMVKNGS